MGLTGTGVTTPTPWDWPLRLGELEVSGGDLDKNLGYQRLSRQLIVTATTNNDLTLVARGDVEKTKKQLKAGKSTKIRARIKQSRWKRLNVAKKSMAFPQR
jgi:hypothetical protein